MGKLFGLREGRCRELADELNAIHPTGAALRSTEDLLELLTPELQAHLAACDECRNIFEDYWETRIGLEGMADTAPEAGPWFTARVMSAIAAQEAEDAVQDGVWISVRRLAPRLVAFSVLLLILGGTWAMELRKTESSASGRRGWDVITEPSAQPTLFDDGFTSVEEARR